MTLNSNNRNPVIFINKITAMSVSIDIRLKKANKTYHEGDLMKGTVVINSSSESKIDGLIINCEGFVAMQVEKC